MADYHIGAMIEETLNCLATKPDGKYLDATFGAGGHSKGILDQLGINGRVLAMDTDRDALPNLADDPRLTLVHHNFKYILQYASYLSMMGADGMIADLGLSSHHVDAPERGFSFRNDGPLDMRMDGDAGQTAAEFLMGLDALQLQQVLSQYGEIPNAKTLAAALLTARDAGLLTSTAALARVAEENCPVTVKLSKYLAMVFQAIRIAVNGELDNLKKLLEAAERILKPGGILVIISYHSLEDRMVKDFFHRGIVKKDSALTGANEKLWKPLSAKAISPSPLETENNPRARSAKLRAARKLSNKHGVQ